MKHRLFTLLTLALIALVSSCSHSESPSVATEHFYQAIIDKDFATAVTYTNLDSADYSEGAAFIEMFMSDLGDNPTFKVLSESIDEGDTTAKVKVNVCFFDDDSELDVDLVLKDNEWKVLFM